jgi:5'(3')-deoxyribonucleotidase
MDEVVVDLCSKWIKVYNERYDDNQTVESLMTGTWDFHKKTKAGEDVYKIIREPGFFENLEPIDGAIDGIKHLISTHDVMLLSNPSGSGEICRGKYAWVEKYLPFFDMENIILTKRKEFVKGTIMIDDNPDFLHKWSKQMPAEHYTILVSHPHNVGCDMLHIDYRCNGWDDILKAVHNVSH